MISIVLLYTLLGFLLVPWLAERQLVKTLHERLAVEVSVEKIDFNPYTFEMSVDNLQLSNEQYEPLATWDRLYLNLQPLRLSLLKIRFEEITIDEPGLHFRRYSESENTLTRLADNWNAAAEDEVAPEENTKQKETSEQDDPLFTLESGDFNYNDGQVAYLSVCVKCGGEARIIACIEDQAIIDRILAHLFKKGALLPPPDLLPAARASPLSGWLS